MAQEAPEQRSTLYPVTPTLSVLAIQVRFTALEDAAVATSGDYRHWVEVNGRRLSHTMDPRRGAPLSRSPASVTVVAQSCAEADAWATALMVLGPEAGPAAARRRGLDALFLLRQGDGSIATIGAGPLFARG